MTIRVEEKKSFHMAKWDSCDLDCSYYGNDTALEWALWMKSVQYWSIPSTQKSPDRFLVFVECK